MVLAQRRTAQQANTESRSQTLFSVAGRTATGSSANIINPVRTGMDEGTGTHLSFQHLSEEAEPFHRPLLKTVTTGKHATTHFSALR